MDSSVSPKDEIWFLRVCHHISNAVYTPLNVGWVCVCISVLDLGADVEAVLNSVDVV